MFPPFLLGTSLLVRVSRLSFFRVRCRFRDVAFGLSVSGAQLACRATREFMSNSHGEESACGTLPYGRICIGGHLSEVSRFY